MAIKSGGQVTMLSTSPDQEVDARRLGAHKFAVTNSPDPLKELSGYFDLITEKYRQRMIYNTYLQLLIQMVSLYV